MNEAGEFSGCDQGPFEEEGSIQMESDYFDNEFREKDVLYSTDDGYWIERKSIEEGRNLGISEIEEMRKQLYSGVPEEFTETVDKTESVKQDKSITAN